MSIAANANQAPFSVRRSGRAGCDLAPTSVSAPPNGEGRVYCSKTINISPLMGEDKSLFATYDVRLGFHAWAMFEWLHCCWLSSPAPWKAP
jgi:hypothetical protein